MTYGGLFEGIGGFALAAQWAGFTPVWSNEIDPFCCKVLRKNFTHEIIEADIRDCGKGRKHELRPVDIICGGFPCQPFSKAGNKSGRQHNDYLWHEMFRVVKAIKPKIIVGENVANITNMGLEEMLTGLEGEGYEIELFNIPAISIGASHKRERIWIVAYNHQFRLQVVQQNGVQKIFGKKKNKCLQIKELFRLDRKKGWVYQPPICGVNDGIPEELDKDRLKALGNAIVPQVAFEIFKAIKSITNS